MKTPKYLMKDTRNLINHANPTKSFFTIELKRDNNFIMNNNYSFHYHDWYEFYYMYRGGCFYHVENKSFPVNQGDWIFVLPGQRHKNIYNPTTNERYLICATKDFLSPVILARLNTLIDYPIYTPYPEDASFIDSLVEKMVREFQTPTDFSTELIKSYLLELLVLFITHNQQRNAPIQYVQQNNIDVQIRFIIDYINLHYKEDLSLEGLAELCDIGANYLSRKFRHYTGTTVVKYIRMRRVEKAKELLIKTNDSISEIAYQCGFNDSNYFSYVFKQSEKISPLKYRKVNS